MFSLFVNTVDDLDIIFTKIMLPVRTYDFGLKSRFF